MRLRRRAGGRGSTPRAPMQFLETKARRHLSALRGVCAHMLQGHVRSQMPMLWRRAMPDVRSREPAELHWRWRGCSACEGRFHSNHKAKRFSIRARIISKRRCRTEPSHSGTLACATAGSASDEPCRCHPQPRGTHSGAARRALGHRQRARLRSASGIDRPTTRWRSSIVGAAHG